ncbi:hypothetical protein T01_11613 [Trichinella spiralis]|uniref:Uncharacterized protein n=1 Tax=Trichinella spiralis TaxID=6334 RepID=A0A0V1B962_TRISP|nr:hypothetical protein T01_11613 [Trichinella spiralis]
MYLQVRLAKVERIGHSSLKPPEILAAGRVGFIICFWLASRSWRSTWCACMNAAVRVLLHFRPHPTTAPDRREIEMLIADFLMNLPEELFLTSSVNIFGLPAARCAFSSEQNVVKCCHSTLENVRSNLITAPWQAKHMCFNSVL